MLNYLDMSSGKIFLYFKQNVHRLFLFYLIHMYIHCYCYCTFIFLFVCGAVPDRVNLSISFSFVDKQLLLLFLRSWYK